MHLTLYASAAASAQPVGDVVVGVVILVIALAFAGAAWWFLTHGAR